MPTADTAKMVAELGLRDKMSPGLDKAIGKIGKLEGRVGRLGSHVQRGLGNAARNTERAITVGITAAAGALAYSVKQAVDAESAIAGIAKTVDGDISGVVDSLKTLSNTIPVSFGELAGIAELGGAMGIAKKDLVEFTRQVAILGTTTNVSVEDAATALGQMANVIGLTGKEFDNFAAALVDLGNKGASTEAQILEIARRSGGAAHLIGVAKDATLGWASAAANLGLNEELAGTALQRFFVMSQNLVSGGGADLNKFAKISGKTAAQFKKAFAKDATGALTDFLDGLGEMSKGRRITAVQDLFGKGTGLTRLILGLSDSIDKNLTPSLNTSTTAWEKATAAQVEADKRFATSASQFKILKQNIDNAAATIGANLLPVLAELSKEGVAFLSDPKTQANIKAFGKDLATGARDAVKWLKSLDWAAIGNSLKIAAGAGKSLVDAFLNAPPWLQQFLTVGFVANKFTGGALGDLFGETIKIAFNQFGARGSSPANPVFVSGGIGGGVPGAAGGRGNVVGALGFAGLIVAAAVPIGEAFADALPPALKGPDGLGRSESQTRITNAKLAEIAANTKAKINITVDNRGHEGAGFRPAPAGPTPFARPDRDDAVKTAVDRTTTAVETMRGNMNTKFDISATRTTQAGLEAKNAGTYTSAAVRTAAITTALAAKNAGASTSAAVRTAGITSALAAKNAAGTTSAAARAAGITAGLASKNAGDKTAAAAAAAGRNAAAGGRAGGATAAAAVRAKKWRFTNNITIPVTTNISVRDQYIQMQKVTRYSTNRED